MILKGFAKERRIFDV